MSASLQEDPYQVRIPAFEGPLDLLLQLIEARSWTSAASHWPKWPISSWPTSTRWNRSAPTRWLTSW